jgi:hypothetical protein
MAKEKINFMCPICGIDVKEDDMVRFDPVRKRFAHEDCVLEAQKKLDKENKDDKGPNL